MRPLPQRSAASCHPFAPGEIYCSMLASCEMALDVRRAEQWMSVADAFARRSNFVPIGAICRMHYGGILTTAGRWKEAEQELTTSIRIYDAGYRGGRARGPWSRLPA